jgi:protein-tyrosine phosphatase
MVAQYVEQGVEVVAATPHVTYGWGMPPLDLPQRCAALAAETGGRLSIVPGAEIYLVADTARRLEERRDGHRPLGESRYVLCEFNLGGSAIEAVQPLGDLLDAGWRPVLAHAERYGYFWRNVERLVDILRMGVLVQVTAGSLIGEFGRNAQGLGERLIQHNLVAMIATDAHHAGRRRPRLAEGRDAVAALVGSEAADRLTRGNPSAILADERISVDGDPAALVDDGPQRSFLGELLR